MPRPYCQQPTACQAKGAGHCRSCNGRRQADEARRDDLGFSWRISKPARLLSVRVQEATRTATD
jgi:hypothetical protein